MKILKPGKVGMRKFVCPNCECEFVCHKYEEAIFRYEGKLIVPCPICGGNSVWDNGEPYEEPTPTETDRDRLIQLLQEARTKHLTKEVVDYLIENGVTFREKLP